MINLLPEEMREKEQLELAKLKKQKEKGMEMTQPTLGKEPPKIEKGPGFFGFLKSFRQGKSEQAEVEKIGEEKTKENIESAAAKLSTKPAAKTEIPKSEESLESFENVKRVVAQGGGEKILPREAIGQGLEISLMPSTEQITPRLIRQRRKIFLAGLVSAIVVLLVVWIGFKIHYGNVLGQIKKIEREISIVKEQTQEYLSLRDRIIILNKKAIQAEKILTQHAYWTKFFNALDANTVPGIFYDDIGADAGGKISLSAAGKDIISIVQQLVSFQQAPNFIKDISINNITRREKGINFILGLNLIDDFFKK